MRILLVDDDQGLLGALCFHLKRAAYTVDTCENGADALGLMLHQAYDVVILDRMLPGMDGMAALRAARAQGLKTPVLMLTALDAVGDRVEGLTAGADDYLPKPFAVEELLARVAALGRRPPALESLDTLHFGDISLQAGKRLLQGKRAALALTGREAQLLAVLMRNGGQVLPRSVLFSRVWGPDAPVEDANLDTYIHFLRKRLKEAGSTLSLSTVRGVGYRLEEKGC